MKIRTTIISLLIVSLTSLAACTKDVPGPDGRDGRDGKDGINGVDGQDGLDGQDGQDGKDGNANVVSGTATVTSWTYQAPSYIGVISFPAITSSIFSTGAVLVYLRTSSTSWSQLPITFYASSSYSTTLEVIYGVGTVNIYWSDSDRLQPDYPGSQTFRIVAIASSQLKENPDVNLSDYNEVKRAFNIN